MHCFNMLSQMSKPSCLKSAAARNSGKTPEEQPNEDADPTAATAVCYGSHTAKTDAPKTAPIDGEGKERRTKQNSADDDGRTKGQTAAFVGPFRPSLSSFGRSASFALSAFSPPLSLAPPFGLGFAAEPTHALSSFSRCD